MKIVIAPDSFKGSLSSARLCEAIAAGVRRVAPDADIVEIPLADGGEGTVEALVRATGGTLKRETVTGPLGRPVEAAYGILGDGRTAVLETAETSGLTLVPEAARDPLNATSRGLGELIGRLLDRGCRDFIIGLGGSATNDGGTGLLRALGVRFLDAAGQPLPEGGGALLRLDKIETSGLHPAVREAAFTVACDVDNPLCGERGASAVFGPQKGATPEMVRQLDAALTRYADITCHQTGIRLTDIAGGGAAGGIGAALSAFLGGTMRPGIEIVLQAAGWEDAIRDADLILTGEGRLDSQTLSGKTIHGICDTASRHNVPVVALAGSVSLTAEEMDRLGLAGAFSIVPGPVSLAQAMAHAEEWAAWQTAQILRVWRNGR